MTSIRAATPDDGAAEWLRRSWGEPVMAVRGRLFDLTALPSLVAVDDVRIVGLLTYDVAEAELEIVSCDAEPAGQGAGRALVSAAIQVARTSGASRLRCTTTNDNLPALGFWQALGFRLVALRPNAVAEARRLKPSIPGEGYRGLPIRDELDLALDL